MERFDFGIIIPALNEEKTIGKVVNSAINFGLPIVIDDGSLDKTSDIARDAGALVVTHTINKGYDSALNTGFERAMNAGCVYGITMDADGQHDPTVIHEIKNQLLNGADLVCGNRDKKQRISEHLFGFIGNIMWGLKDPLCGLKGYKMVLYKELGHFDSYSSIGTELAIHAARNSKKIIQIPVKTLPRNGSSRFGSTIKANYKIFRSLVKGLWWYPKT